MSWTRLSHLGGSGLTPGQSTKTLAATQLGRKGREKNLTDRTSNQMVKANLNRRSHTKKHTHTPSEKEKKRDKNKIKFKKLIKINKRKRATKPINRSSSDNKH